MCRVLHLLAHGPAVRNRRATSKSVLASSVQLPGPSDYCYEHRYGAAFEAVKARTSIVPFLAVLDGRQVSCQR
jgi:uncharacterized membrane protein